MVWGKTLEDLKIRLGWRNNADWILTSRTQFDERNLKGRKQQLVIGLDFGTAFTKVVIGEQRIRYAVPFAPYSHKKNPYLLPTALSIVNDNQECLLGFADGIDRRIEDLKMRLINRDFSIENKVFCAAFLALVLRFVRGWLLDTHGDTYKDRQLIWLVNVGLPTNSYHDQELVTVYREITHVAWTVSVLPGPVSLPRIRHYIDKGKIDFSKLPSLIADRLLDPQYIHTFPEFAVQLAGYARSPRRQDGLHTLIDIGAGTVDFTTFNVHRNNEGEDLFPIFAREVKPLGTWFLVQHRLSQKPPKTDWQPSPFEDVPDDSIFESKLSLNQGMLNKIDQPYRQRVEELISDKLNYTKRYRDPRSPYWQSGVPMFVCGGGAKVSCFIDVFHRFEKAKPPFMIKPSSLTVPEDLKAQAMPKGTYDRLSVAYGLSYDPYDIGTILRMEEVDDFDQAQVQTKTYRDRYTSKDMV